MAAKLGQPSCSLSNVCSGEPPGHNLSISLLLLLTGVSRANSAWSRVSSFQHLQIKNRCALHLTNQFTPSCIFIRVAGLVRADTILVLESYADYQRLTSRHIRSWQLITACNVQPTKNVSNACVSKENGGEATRHLQGKRTVKATQVPLRQRSRINFTPGPQCCYITNIDGTSPLYLAPHPALCYYP